MNSSQTIGEQYKSRLSFVNFKNGIIFDASVFLICCLSFVFSWIESSVNLDSHHWGVMYVQAIDIKRGLIPHKETVIFYGYLTSWIQGLSLNLFGDSLKSIGIATGAFYSVTFFLSYKIFLKFLSKPLSCLSVLLIFLLHVRIVFPWPNYFVYTFQLLSILSFISDRKISINRFFSGLCLGLAWLCRYSSIVAILPPFLIFIGYELLIQKNDRKIALERMVLFGFGFLTPLILFFGFLISNHAWHDFYIQNRIISKEWSDGVNLSNFLPRLLKSVVLSKTEPSRDLRSVFFTINFFWISLTLCYFFHQIFFKKKSLNKVENIIIAVSLVSIFGYFNAIHSYQVFRLANGASIGGGVIVYAIIKVSNRINNRARIIMGLSLLIICFVWVNSLAECFRREARTEAADRCGKLARLAQLFTRTSSVYNSWRFETLTGKGIAPTEIKLFQGKILSTSYYDFYDEIFHKLSRFDNSYYIVNYTWDPIAMIINGLSRAQLSPIYFPALVYAYPEETEKIQQIINSRKAVLLSGEDLQIPGYKLIFAKPWSEDTPWLPQLEKKLYIIIPEETDGSNPR